MKTEKTQKTKCIQKMNLAKINSDKLNWHNELYEKDRRKCTVEISQEERKKMSDLNAQRNTEEKYKSINKLSGKKRERVRFYLLLPSRKDENCREKNATHEG